MASESLLFQSWMGLLGHAVTHFLAETEQDRTLLILHLLNFLLPTLKHSPRDQPDNALTPAPTCPVAAVHSGFFKDLISSSRGKQLWVP